MAGYRDMVYKTVSHSSKWAAFLSGTGNFMSTPPTKQLYIGDNPAGKTVEATALEQPSLCGQPTRPNHLTQSYVGWGLHYRRGAHCGAPRVRLENNTFIWNGLQGPLRERVMGHWGSA